MTDTVLPALTDPAVVTIDLHRGHLDPSVATLPPPADDAAALMERVVPMLAAFRALDVPVVHLVTAYRDREEILSNPYWALQSGRPDSTRAAIAEHNLIGLPGLELMPGVHADGDVVIDTKKRYDCFVGTDLDFVLRSMGRRTLLMAGVNTNSCVLATTVAASVRDYSVIALEDATASMREIARTGPHWAYSGRRSRASPPARGCSPRWSDHHRKGAQVSADPPIAVRHAPESERYEALEDGELVGFTAYRARGDEVVFVHTDVADSLRGHGIGSALAREALDDVRRRGLRAVPMCSFIAAWIRHHPAYHDLVPEESLHLVDAPPGGAEQA